MTGVHINGQIVPKIVSLAALSVLLWKYCQLRKDEIKNLKVRLSKSQQSREEAFELYHSLLQSSPSMIGVISPDYRYLEINTELANLAKKNRADLIGKRCYEIFGTGSVCENCPVTQAFLTKVPVQSQKKEMVHKTGCTYVEITAIPNVDENGFVKHVTEIVIDISDKVKAEKDKEKLFINTINALTKLIDARDRVTGLHSANVKKIALLIADDMKLSYNLVQELETAALLHDIGKVGIPETILCKPGDLSAEEREVMKTHCQIGYEAIAHIDRLSEVSKAVLYHHECYDGTGYPHGLKANDIPLLARILTVADVWEALSADRPYRKAYSFHDAMKIMLSKRGTHFDPKVFDHFISAMAKTDERFNLLIKRINKQQNVLSKTDREDGLAQ